MQSNKRQSINKVIKGLKKASKTHAKQAKTLSKVLKARDGILVRGTGAQVKKLTYRGDY